MTGDPTLPVSLHPVTEADLPALEEFCTEAEVVGAFQWFGWRDPAAFRRGWEENRLLNDAGTSVVVVREGGLPCGLASWRRERTSPVSSCWNMGAQLHPSATGRGIGSRAQLLLVHHLFDTTPVFRIEADTEVDNVAERRALEKCGFAQEGVMRGRTFRAGAWRDVVRYAILRDDPLPPL
jgi:RimJ/RimL family protein N-acetyltransferase